MLQDELVAERSNMEQAQDLEKEEVNQQVEHLKQWLLKVENQWDEAIIENEQMQEEIAWAWENSGDNSSDEWMLWQLRDL